MKEEVNIFKKQIVGYQLLSAALAIGIVAMFADTVMLHAENEALRDMNDLLLEIDYEQYQQYKTIEEVEEPIETYQEVVFTNYYPNDSEGSKRKTGSGLTTDDFEVNELGFYTYENKIVIAAATYECLKSSYGGCSTIKSSQDLPSDYKIFNYFDELEIEIDGIRYEAIVLDSCLASWWEREYQTYDIYIASKDYAFGKLRGKVYENN